MENGNRIFANNSNIKDMAFNGYAIKTGLACTGGGAGVMTVVVAAGYYYVAGVLCYYAGGSVVIAAADATYPRKDIISISSAGVLTATAGSPVAATPVGSTGPDTITPIPPDIPTDETTLCEVWVAAGVTGILTSAITSIGITAASYGAFDYGMSFQGTVSGVVGSPTEVQCSDLIGYGDDYFKGYWIYVVWDAGAAGAAPQSEKKLITSYTSLTGNFVFGAFTVPLAATDKILVMHPAIMGDVVVEVGEMDDTATAADLSDIASTSVHSKLGRVLLRFSAAAFAATVNGSSRTDVAAMVTGLASYIKAAGATFAPSIGGATRADIDAALAALDAEIYTAAHTLKTPNTKIGDIARTIDLILGARWDSSGDLGTDVGTIITAVDTTIPDLIAALVVPDAAGTAAGIINTTDKLNLLLAATDGAASTLAAANVADGSIIAKLASKAANGATPEAFNCTTDSLEALSDKIGAFTGDGGADQGDSIKADLDLINDLVDGLETSAGKVLCSMDFWSASVEEISVDGDAGTLDLANDVVVADLPAGATVVRAIVMFAFRAIENTNAAANKLDGATVANTSQVIQIDDAGNTGWLDCLTFVDDQFSIAGSTREGGTILVGNADVAARVDGNDTYDFQWLQSNADQDDLNFNDTQIGIRIWYSV